MKRYSFILLLIIAYGCNDPITYKYQDKPQLVECPGVDKALLHEAFYSFKEDVGAFYKRAGRTVKNNDYYINGFMQFVYFGFSGTADFKKIASPHTLLVFEELKKENIWNLDSEISNLNYNSEYISCLFENFKNEELRTKFKNLQGVDYFSPEIIADYMRINVSETYNDPHLAMYMALDAYYQYLHDIDFPENE